MNYSLLRTSWVKEGDTVVTFSILTESILVFNQLNQCFSK